MIKENDILNLNGLIYKVVKIVGGDMIQIYCFTSDRDIIYSKEIIECNLKNNKNCYIDNEYFNK